jgi:hypothetical protein
MNQVNLDDIEVQFEDEDDEELNAFNPHSNFQAKTITMKKNEATKVVSSNNGQKLRFHKKLELKHNGNMLTTQQLENAKIGTLKKVVATPIKVESAQIKI